MAFTENQLRNITGIEDEWMTIPLIPSGVVTEDEIENWTNVYIGVDYAPGPPIADFAFAIVAETLQVDFFDQSENQPEEWLWDFGDPSSGSNSSADQYPIHFFTGYGSFEVTLTVTNGLGTDSITKTVTIENHGVPFVPIHNHVTLAKKKLIEQFRTRP